MGGLIFIYSNFVTFMGEARDFKISQAEKFKMLELTVYWPILIAYFRDGGFNETVV